MILPPSFVRIRVQGAGRRRLGWWIPVFLLWPLLLLLTLLAPLVLLPVALLGGGPRRSLRYLGAWFLVLLVLCRTRHLRVRVEEPGKDLLVAVY